jgi:hypothetical protein
MASFGEKLFGESEKTGSTTEDIARARTFFRMYMDWAMGGLSDIGDQSAKNRKKSASSLFELQNIGDPAQKDILQQGYGNAQDRLSLTQMGMRNARLGLPADDRYLDARSIDASMNPLLQTKLPNLAFEKGPRNPQRDFGMSDEMLAWGI